MEDKHLSLLAQASQPTQCAQCLIESPILRVLSQAIAEFCHKQLQNRGGENSQQSSTPSQQSTQGMFFLTLLLQSEFMIYHQI